MYNPQPGDPLDAVDTPAMLIDLDLMEANIARLFERFRNSPVKVRPHLKTVKSPVLAKKMIEAGAIGGCVAKVSEAEVMAEAGIEDLLITTEVMHWPKFFRLMTLLKSHPQIKVVVDNLQGAENLNMYMQQMAIKEPLQILLDLNVGQNRTGVAPDKWVVPLAREISKLDRLKLIGVQGYEGHLQHIHDRAEREQRCREAMEQLTGTAFQLREAGFNIEIVTTGGTGTAEFCAVFPGVTEVQPGSFIFMDTDYRNAIGPVYANALTILSTVISHTRKRQAIIDAGLKSLSTDSGFAEPKDWPGVRYRPGGDEHGILEWDEGVAGPGLGDQVEMIPSHIDTTVNLHDNYYAIRRGKIEAIWPVATRGKVQ
jgi:D-serine deaminase-like pyridoxal phosphate-dependent protein